jgi:lysozyme family protein
MIHNLINRLIQREGGYVNHPDDKGGPTNMGITLRTLASWRGTVVTARDVKDLGYDEAAAIYRQRYWIDPGLFTLSVSPLLMAVLFDAAVHHGPRKAVQLLQRSIGVKDDGIIGPITRECVGRMRATNMMALFVAERVEYMGYLVKKDPTQSDFIHGWLRRMSGFITDIPLA